MSLGQRMILHRCIAAIIGLLVGTTAVAQPVFDADGVAYPVRTARVIKPIASVTTLFGAGLWSHELGVDSSPLIGLRGAWHPARNLTFEFSYGNSNSERSADNTKVTLKNLGLGLVWDLNHTAAYVPYLTAGWMKLDQQVAGSSDQLTLNGSSFGLGLRKKLGGNDTNYTALRLEIRDLIAGLTPVPGEPSRMTHNLFFSLGFQVALGHNPRDRDGDGVLDPQDKCPDVPAGPMGDQYGCPLDSDYDDVCDIVDRCPDTPEGATVDEDGCPMDSDGDGVPDGLDRCRGTATNLRVDKHGCPLTITEIEVQLLDTGSISTSRIVFATGSAEIDLEHSSVLQEIGEVLSLWPQLRVEIVGHTDNVGAPVSNQRLSLARAQAVMDHLQANFPAINVAQYSTRGQGEGQPIANNGTENGRQANRRVEFRVLNTDELKRKVRHRRTMWK